jgi:hypothetical protein
MKGFMLNDTLEQRVEKLLREKVAEAIGHYKSKPFVRLPEAIASQFREPLLAAFKALAEIDAASSYGKGSGPKMVEAKEKVRAALALLDQDGEGGAERSRS